MTSAVSIASSCVAVAGVLAASHKAVQTPATRRGTYRVCTLCGLNIPPVRLKAQPSATECVRCLEAQGDVERVHDGDTRHTSISTETFVRMFDGGEKELLVRGYDDVRHKTTADLLQAIDEDDFLTGIPKFF